MHKIFTALFKPDTRLSRWLVALLLIAVFATGALGYLDPARDFLDSEALTFKIGSLTLSLYKILKGLIAFILLFWFASIVASIGEKQLKNLKGIKASNRSLLIKGFQIAVYFVMFLIGLDVLGIDLTALTVFGGAIGIGIGFGLQKITSNFISGLILLFEKSVEEGDLVELSDGIQGYIRQTGARYTLIETFDCKEVMVPNEDFITNRVTNWTYSNTQGRIEIFLGVSYDSDIEKARELILEAATEHPRCITDPAPVCFLREFADSSVNFLLFFWVEDVTLGRYEPQSDVMRSIWKKFRENDISIPYPQRDLHIKNPEALK